MILRGERCSGACTKADSHHGNAKGTRKRLVHGRRSTEQLECELMLGIVRKGSKRKVLLLLRLVLFHITTTTFFFVGGSCYCLKVLYPFVRLLLPFFHPPHYQLTTTMPDPTQAPTKSKSAAPAQPTPRKVRFNVGMHLLPLIHRLLFTSSSL